MSDQTLNLSMEGQEISLTQGINPEQSETVNGITQAEADARYMMKKDGPTGYVMTNTGGSSADWREPTISFASTNW